MIRAWQSDTITSNLGHSPATLDSRSEIGIPALFAAVAIGACSNCTTWIWKGRKCDVDGRLSGQLIQQRLGLFQIGGIEAFGEPIVDFGEQRVRLIATMLAR